MKNTIHSLLLVILFSLTFVLGFFYFFKPLKCSVNTQIRSGRYAINAMIFYNLEYGLGTVSINGRILKDNEKIADVRIRTFLDYYSIGNDLYLKNRNVVFKGVDNSREVIRKIPLIPEFYFTKDKAFTIHLLPQNKNYIMTTDSMFPSLYCNK